MNEVSELYDLAIVGDGVAAHSILFYLSQLQGTQKIIQISHNKIAPACSLRGSAVVSSHGIEKGVSPLGDKLYSAYLFFEKFLLENTPDGVESAKRLHFDKKEQRLKRRFGFFEHKDHKLLKEKMFWNEEKSFLVQPEVFLDWFSKNTKKPTRKVTDLIVDFSEKNELVTLKGLGAEIHAKKVIFATGAFSKLYQEDEAEVLKTKMVAGQYLKSSCDLGPNPFVLTFPKFGNLIYRAKEKELLIGSSSLPEAIQGIDGNKLVELYDFFKKVVDFKIPSISKFEILTGMRHKGVKRQPFSGKLQNYKHVYGLFCLYKNGWTLGPYLASQLVNEL